MTVLTPDLTIHDFFLPGSVFLVLCFLALFITFVKTREALITAAVTMLAGMVGAFAFIPVIDHHNNIVSDLENRFEDGYGLEIIDKGAKRRDIPFEESHGPEAVRVVLDDAEGPQVIVVEVVGGQYVVTHNGEVREPVDTNP